MNSHPSLDTANYAAIHRGPDGKASSVIAGGGPRLSLGPARPGGPVEHLFQTTVGTSHRSSLLQKCPPACGAGHNCHDLAERRSSEPPPPRCHVAPAEATAAQRDFYVRTGLKRFALKDSDVGISTTALSRETVVQDRPIAPRSEISLVCFLWINWFPDEPERHTGRYAVAVNYHKERENKLMRGKLVKESSIFIWDVLKTIKMPGDGPHVLVL